MVDAISLLSSDEEEEESVLPLAQRLKARGVGDGPSTMTAALVNLTDSSPMLQDEAVPERKQQLLKAAASEPLQALSPGGARAQPRAAQGEASAVLRKERAPARGKDKQTELTSGAERAAPTQQQRQAYLAARRACVKARRFNLRSVSSGTISTSRTIKPMAAWAGLWPALREFMQNTIDHLALLGADGRLNSALEMTTTPVAGGGVEVRFTCGATEVCAIRAAGDELVIEQAFTFPMHPRALDTGVSDRTKGGEATAGGFGDGFKTAAISLLSQPALGAHIEWWFEAEGACFHWQFVGAPRAAVGTFRASQVLEVHVSATLLGEPQPGCRAAGATAADGAEPPPPAEHRMLQLVRAKGIGAAFSREAMPRLQVFWHLSDAGVLSCRKGGSLLADAAAQPPVRGSTRAPEPGLYVRGIWVRKPLIEGTLMCFDGKSAVDVTGRDRNDVDVDEAAEATLKLLHNCTQRELLRALCQPLRGGNGAGGREKGSWLLRSPRFSNRLLEAEPAFFVQSVLGVPQGAVFVSKRTTESKEPFVAWASSYLAARDAPLLPLEAGAHKALFKEASEAELEALCVKHLLHDEKDAPPPAAVAARAALASRVLKFVGATKLKLHFSERLSVAFVHGSHIFVPGAQPLSRALLVRLLGVMHRRLGGYDERFTHLQQALFEQLPPDGAEVSGAQLDAVLKRAEGVQKEAKAFERAAATGSGGAGGSGAGGKDTAATDKASGGGGSSSGAKRPRVEAPQEGGGDGSRSSGKRRAGESGGARGGAVCGRAELERQIGALSRGGGGEEILPSSAFAAEASGDARECLRPASTLHKTAVPASLGGGHIFCDAASTEALRGGTLSAARQATLRRLREALEQSKRVVAAALPSLRATLASVVHAGFDASNDGYLGFCTNTAIVVNLHPLMGRRPEGDGKALTHELLMTVAHEVAHLCERGGDHGPGWRSTYDEILKAVYCDAVSGAPGAFAQAAVCTCCAPVS